MTTALPVRQAMKPAHALGSSTWFLCEKNESEVSARVVNVNASPFQIGRLPGLALCLSHTSVSKLHAEIVLQGQALWVRDLGSTNGTFVNGRRIREATPLHHGDLLQVAGVVFRIDHRPSDACSRTITESSAGWAHALCQFDHLMNMRDVVPHFQPVVRLSDRATIGFEALGRSKVEGLEQPGLMFAAAEKFGQECPLSRMLRREAVRVGRGLPTDKMLFVNTHPAEVVTAELIASLRELRSEFPAQHLTIEIHEAAATDIKALIDFRSILRELQMQLAFDDFGAGQSRLLHLTEAMPELVKFDMQMIRGIHEAAAPRQRALAALVQMVRDLGIATLAEGIESDAERIACQQLGFEFAQGFLFGRPAPLPADPATA